MEILVVSEFFLMVQKDNWIDGIVMMDQVNFGVPIAVSNNGGVVYFCPELEPNGCMTITGPSGSGKSTFLNGMERELSKGYPVMVLSPHDDLPRLMGRSLLVTEDGIDGFGINPFNLSRASIQNFGVVGSSNRIVSLLERFGDKFGVQQKAALRTILMDFAIQNVERGSSEISADDKFGIVDIFTLIEDKIDSSASSRERGVLQSLLSRVSQVAAMPIFSKEHMIDPAVFLQYSAIIDLSKVRGDVRSIISESILMMVQDHIFSLGSVHNGERRFRIFIMVDEAKVFFGEKSRREDPEHPLNVLATEGRKYGAGLIVASQRVEHLSSDLIGNASVKMVMGPICDAREKRKLSSDFDLSSSDLKCLSSPGWAFVSGARISPGVYKPIFSAEVIQPLPFSLQSPFGR